MVKAEKALFPHLIEEEVTRNVRFTLYKADRAAVDACDYVVAYVDRHPSEGTLWEMGYAVGRGKSVVLVNACNWKFNLMPEFGSAVVDSTEAAVSFLSWITP
jgi:nucleoside 2-deoxyribosyltransferase